MSSIWRTSVRELWRRGLSRIGQALYREAVAGAVQEALDTHDFTNEDYGYRTRSWTERDLSPIGHEVMLRMARHLWARNPVAKRCLEIHRDFVVSEGFEIRATCPDPKKRERVQAKIDEHWDDPRNKWPERIGQRVMEVAQFGELTLHRFVNPINGHTRWGFVAPENIERVEADILDAENLKWVVLKEPCEVKDEWGLLTKRDRLRIIHRDENPESETYGQLVGDVVHLSINRMSGATRGLSDLLSVADILDRLTILIGSECDRAQFLKAFLWDVEVDGDPKTVKARAAELRKRAPRPGTNIVHNKKEKWTAIAPDLKAADMLEFLRFLLVMCLGALGIPVHYFADAENVNKASAAEMADPVYARVRERQNVVKTLLTTVFQYALERSRAAGPLRDCTDDDLAFEVVTIDPDRSEHDKQIQALLTAVEAFTKAAAVGFVSQRQAAEAWKQCAKGIGVEFPEEEGQNGGVDEEPAPGQQDVNRSWLGRVQDMLRGKRPAAKEQPEPEKQAA